MTQAEYNANLTVNLFRGLADEFPMLKGIICLSHGHDYEQSQRINALCDGMVIAHRLDDIAHGKAIIGPLYYRRQQREA